MPATDTIRQTVWIPAKPVQVYDVFVNARKHSAFTGARATGEAAVGQPFTAFDGYISGEYVELVRARRIVQRWRTSEWPQDLPDSLLELTLTEKNDGTEIHMVHSGVPANLMEPYRQGWIDYCWNPLKEYFEPDAE